MILKQNGGENMRATDNYQVKSEQSSSTKDNQAFQNALNEAEQALAGDPLQEAVQQKKNEQG